MKRTSHVYLRDSLYDRYGYVDDLYLLTLADGEPMEMVMPNCVMDRLIAEAGSSEILMPVGLVYGETFFLNDFFVYDDKNMQKEILSRMLSGGEKRVYMDCFSAISYDSNAKKLTSTCESEFSVYAIALCLVMTLALYGLVSSITSSDLFPAWSEA